jgi:hypothetical protein
MKSKNPKGLSDEAIDSIDALDNEGLRWLLSHIAQKEEETLDAKANDEELEAAKGMVRELAAPYSETLQDLRARRRYAVKRLEQVGQSLVGQPDISAAM